MLARNPTKTNSGHLQGESQEGHSNVGKAGHSHELVIEESKWQGLEETVQVGESLKGRLRQPIQAPWASYRNWTPHPLADPRVASIKDVIPGLVEIIATEHPMPCHRVYRIYARACGIQRVGRQIRRVFNKAIAKALRLKLIEQRNEHETVDQINKIVRGAGNPPVVFRTRGDRTLHEIPPAEVGALMNWLLAEDPDMDDVGLFRSVLNWYEISRMTSVTQVKLRKIKDRFVS